jgi:hypothetical protein
VGRGALPGVPRPKYGVEYERDADVFGTVLCALIVVGGRGMDRIGEVLGIPPDLTVEPVAGLLTPRFDIGAVLPKLCGGRGT